MSVIICFASLFCPVYPFFLLEEATQIGCSDESTGSKWEKEYYQLATVNLCIDDWKLCNELSFDYEKIRLQLDGFQYSLQMGKVVDYNK